jgi:acyl-ACP thioesterase
MEINNIWQEQFKIDAAMVDATRRVTLTSICNILQVAAGHHANFRKIGFDQMNAAGRFWALNRLIVKMQAYPMWLSTVKLHTWVHRMRGPFSYRNFELFNEAGEVIGAASTLWVAVDASTRKPIRVDVGDFPIIPDKTPPSGEPNKVTIPKTLAASNQEEHPVRYSDLDMINHVNNVKYIEWILDTYGTEERLKSPSEFEATYIQETHATDTILITTYQSQADEYYHELTRKSDEKAVLKAKLKW